MEPIIAPVDRALLLAELTPERKVRDTKRAGNEIYLFVAAECPNLMREVGRLREEAFRGAGGGTGMEVDIDEEDLAEDGYCQLIVWDPAAQEIVGGYIETVTFAEDACIVCNEEGRLKGLAPCMKLLGVDFVGTCMVVGVKGEEFCSVPKNVYNLFFRRNEDENTESN